MAMRFNKILSMAVAAAALLSCAKEMNPDQGGVNNTDKELMTIVAQVEQQVETKTSLSGNVVSWTEGDKLSVFSGVENVLFELKEINNGSGKFEGDAPAAETYYALYPYSTTATISEDGVISTVLPCNQNGVAGSFDNELNISVAKFASEAMTMRNVCGLVKLNITRTDVTSVTLFGNGHEYLAGAIDITIAEDGTPSYTVKNGVKYVMLTPKTGETFAPGTYYFTVLPQTLKGGMSLVYNVADQSGTVATGSDAAVNRSEYLNITANPENALALNNILDLSNPDGDATSETANCYVAGLAGRRYCFPATVMGNGVTTPADDSYPTTNYGSSPELAPTPINPEKAMLLWQTAQSLVKHVVLKDGKIYFTLNGKVGGALTEGNALLAGIGADNLPAWSWHIWVTDDNLDAKVQTWTVHSNLASYSAYQNPQLMDRNLGALTNELWGDCQSNQANGLFYQFGRKDPFPGADDSAKGTQTQVKTYDGNDVELPAAISPGAGMPTDYKWYHAGGTTLNSETVGKYPMLWCRIGNGTYREKTYHNLWGRPPYGIESNKVGSKTIYDPCPPGYKVMNPYAFSGLSTTWQGGKIAQIEHNVINADTAEEDGGLKVYCSDNVMATIPFTGTIANTTYVLHRGNDTGYYWSNTPSAPASKTQYHAMINIFDYNNLLLSRDSYYFSSGNDSYGQPRQFSIACRGNAVRCEVIK